MATKTTTKKTTCRCTGKTTKTTKTTAKSTGKKCATPTLTNEELAARRHEMIAQLAYLKAEKRGFTNGCPVQDWLEAEKEIDQQFAH